MAFRIHDLIIEETPTKDTPLIKRFVMFSESTYRSRLLKAAELIDAMWKNTIDKYSEYNRYHQGIEVTHGGCISLPGDEYASLEKISPFDPDCPENWYHSGRRTVSNYSTVKTTS